MDSHIEDAINGASWTRNCLLGGEVLARALERFQSQCPTGLRHFSAIGVAVPLDQAQSMESEISRLEDELGADA